MSISCLLLAAALTLQADKPFVSEPGGFSIKLPGTPTEQTIKAPSPIGEIDIRLYQLKKGELEYTVSYNDYPDAILNADINKVLDGVRDGFVKGVKGKLVLVKPIKLGNIPGREIEFTQLLPNGKQGSGHARIFIQKTRLYQVVVMGDPVQVDSLASDAFFDSLKIQPLKAAGSKPGMFEAGGFTIAMPGIAIEKIQPLNTPLGATELHLFVLDKGNTAYFVSYNDYPANAKKPSDDQLLESACEGSIQNAKAKLNAKKDIKLGTLPGKEISYTMPLPNGQTANGRSRIFLNGNRLFQILVLSSGDEFDSPDAKAYFDSFKLTKGK